MSDLEEAVIDDIEALHARRIEIEDLTKARRRVLARWALKTGLAIANQRNVTSGPMSDQLYADARRGTWEAGAVAFFCRLPVDEGPFPSLSGIVVPYGHTFRHAKCAYPITSFLAAAAVYGRTVIGIAQFEGVGELALLEGIHRPFFPLQTLMPLLNDFVPRNVVFPATPLNAVCAGIGKVFNRQEAEIDQEGFTPNPYIAPELNALWLASVMGIRISNRRL